ncbi:MAG TPA: hypothetical protein VHF69_00290 [Candidatus Synoicihabitans sp.]|nr:hypothetical protein [Candidatus Synoicihabitans sp.]
MSARPPPKPWPMKWIVVAILACIVPYTWISLHFRKEGPAFQPYQDTKAKAETLRLEEAGFTRVVLDVPRPADARSASDVGTHATITTIPGGFPPVLSETLLDRPLVPDAVVGVRASANTRSDQPYVVAFTCTQPNDQEQIANVTLYVREGELILAPGFERVPGELLSRDRETDATTIIPSGTLTPGSYQITLLGARQSVRWTVQVERDAR